MSRWDDLAVWRPTEAHGGRMAGYRGLVLHIAEGFYEGTIGWQHDPQNEVSSHFVVGRGSGQIAQCVDTDFVSWAQRDGNPDWLSVEFEGFTLGHRLHPTHPGWEQLTDWQVQCAAQLLARAHRRYGVPLQITASPVGRGLGHHSMGGPAWGHIHCPGDPIIAQKPLIVARARQLIGQQPAAAEQDDIMTKLPTLVHGATGYAVKCAQTLANLTLGGENIAVDGIFLADTERQIRRVQAAGRIAQDGVCGPRTWALLLGIKP